MRFVIGLCLILVGSSYAQTNRSSRKELKIQKANGLTLLVAADDPYPTLRVILPGYATSDRAIEIIFPEHITATQQGGSPKQLYMLGRRLPNGPPIWRRVGNSLEYERELSPAIHLLARATLESDGIRFHYEFTNHSDAIYDMIYAVTDPRLTSIFHDARLERTYVHHTNGFDLWASETPARLTMPLDQWFPVRYLASFTWPVPTESVERRSDGISYYNKSRAVDEPFIATLSTDGKWVVASFTRQTGNVWSNPELTCQHVDPQTSLAPRAQAILEMKILILRGSLDDALRRARNQRSSLK